MNDADLYAALTRIFREVLERSDLVLTPALTAAQVAGWDSFKQVEIILEVQERFGIRLSSADVDDLRNVGDLARVVAAKTASPGT